MKAETARLLRAVLRLIEDDVRTWSEAVVEIDEREAAHYVDTRHRLATICLRIGIPDDGVAHSFKAHPPKVCANVGCTTSYPHVHKPEGILYGAWPS